MKGKNRCSRALCGDSNFLNNLQWSPFPPSRMPGTRRPDHLLRPMAFHILLAHGWSHNPRSFCRGRNSPPSLRSSFIHPALSAAARIRASRASQLSTFPSLPTKPAIAANCHDRYLVIEPVVSENAFLFTSIPGNDEANTTVQNDRFQLIKSESEDRWSLDSEQIFDQAGSISPIFGVKAVQSILVQNFLSYQLPTVDTPMFHEKSDGQLWPVKRLENDENSSEPVILAPSHSTLL